MLSIWIIAGIAVVALFLILALIGFLASRNTKPDESKNTKTEAVSAPATTFAPKAVVPPQTDGISQEIIAVIAAAIAAMTPDGKKYAIRSVTRTAGGRSAWSMAGLLQNTRPF